MVDQKIDVTVLLDAVATIQEHGEKQSAERYSMNGVSLDTSIDGYTAVLSNNKGKITINFHNTIHTDFEHNQDLDVFYSQLKKIAEQ